MNTHDMFPFLIISCLIQYVLSGKNSLNCFTTFGSSVRQQSLYWVLFGTATWLPHGHLCVTVEETTSLTQSLTNHCLLFFFNLKATRSLAQQGWVPEPSQLTSRVWTGILSIQSVTFYSTGQFSLVFNVYRPLDYSPLVFNVYSSFLGWFFVFQYFAFLFSCNFCHLVGWFSNGFTFQYVPVCLFSIHHKEKELLAKIKVSVLVI